jgi:hypothetical protein
MDTTYRIAATDYSSNNCWRYDRDLKSLREAIMLTRRTLHIYAVSLGATVMSGIARAQADDMATVRIRVDQTARSVLQPIEQSNLKIEPDQSEEAKQLAAHAPKDRALPIILIIVGAIALTQLLKMIQELYRQIYYGGVLIDNRTQPPTISSDLRIPANMVFVIDPSGKTTQFASEQFDIGALRLALQMK